MVVYQVHICWLDSSNAGAIAGAVVTVLVVLALVAVGVFLFRKYRNKPTPKFIADTADPYNPNDNPIYDELHYMAPSNCSANGAAGVNR